MGLSDREIIERYIESAGFGVFHKSMWIVTNFLLGTIVLSIPLLEIQRFVYLYCAGLIAIFVINIPTMIRHVKATFGDDILRGEISNLRPIFSMIAGYHAFKPDKEDSGNYMFMLSLYKVSWGFLFSSFIASILLIFALN